MLKRQLSKLLQYTDYQKKFKLLKKILNIIKKNFFFDRMAISLSTLDITNKVLKITIIYHIDEPKECFGILNLLFLDFRIFSGIYNF